MPGQPCRRRARRSAFDWNAGRVAAEMKRALQPPATSRLVTGALRTRLWRHGFGSRFHGPMGQAPSPTRICNNWTDVVWTFVLVLGLNAQNLGTRERWGYWDLVRKMPGSDDHRLPSQYWPAPAPGSAYDGVTATVARLRTSVPAT